MQAATEIKVQVVPDPNRLGDLSGQTLTERFADRIRELGAGLGNIANDLREELDRTLTDGVGRSWRLDEVGLAFSLDLEAEAGIIVAKGRTTAGFEASMTWKRLPEAH